jgi:lipopolysaccharide transport system permease protein
MPISPNSKDGRKPQDEMQWTNAGAPAWRIDLLQLWDYRELILVFALRDLQVRYRQTVIGLAWVFLQPLTQLVIFVTFFGWLDTNPSGEGIPYPVAVLCGLILWQVFALAVQTGTTSLVNHRAMITKIYFPRIVLPMAAVLACSVEFFIGWLFLLGAAFWFRLPPSPVWLLSLLALPIVSLTALGISSWTSALNAMYRDVGHVIPFLMQIGFFLTPVVFVSQVLIPARWQPVMALNPLSSTIELFRSCWLEVPAPSGVSLLISALSLLAVVFSGMAFFHRVERILVDRV